MACSTYDITCKKTIRAHLPCHRLPRLPPSVRVACLTSRSYVNHDTLIHPFVSFSPAVSRLVP
ncbi:hypothetical protein F5Y13DRAFT_32954 [Hypoxylon sp. FL1857]|nr:hypothetical protein F5Y13DRAFT_32954 [Hypoxylon sp. FL1857]